MVEQAVGGLGRRLEAIPLYIVEPTVVGASDAALLDPPVEE
jgi:hypothetical protein